MQCSVNHKDLESAKAPSCRMDRDASQLRSGRVTVIGELVPTLNDTFFTALISDICRND